MAITMKYYTDLAGTVEAKDGDRVMVAWSGQGKKLVASGLSTAPLLKNGCLYFDGETSGMTAKL